MNLPTGFLAAPFAHRALHGAWQIKDNALHGAGRVENSPAAIEAACRAGYGIEIDVQLSNDGVAMVFHDDTLDRLTAQTGPLRDRNAETLEAIALTGTQDRIPTLRRVLAQVAGRVPLLIEIKDQTGGMGPDTGTLEEDVAASLAGYGGPVAVMSFNPFSVMQMARLAPGIPRGLTTAAFEGWDLPQATADRLRPIPDYARVGACFISHEAADLASPHVAALRERGARILCWTIRSQAEADAALVHADAITFEGFAPA